MQYTNVNTSSIRNKLRVLKEELKDCRKGLENSADKLESLSCSNDSEAIDNIVEVIRRIKSDNSLIGSVDHTDKIVDKLIDTLSLIEDAQNAEKEMKKYETKVKELESQKARYGDEFKDNTLLEYYKSTCKSKGKQANNKTDKATAQLHAAFKR